MERDWYPTKAIAKRVRVTRDARGWTAQKLADELAAQGVPWTRSTVAKLENGNRPTVSVDEWLALAAVLDISPLHLLVPPLPSPLAPEDGEGSRSPDDPNSPNDNAPYRVTTKFTVPCWRVRQFVRGTRHLPGMNPWKFYIEAPLHERPSGDSLRRLVKSNERRGDDG